MRMIEPRKKLSRTPWIASGILFLAFVVSVLLMIQANPTDPRVEPPYRLLVYGELAFSFLFASASSAGYGVLRWHQARDKQKR
jgi:hypothetical protein